MKLYTKVPIKERKGTAGQSPIFARWVDIIKGDDKEPNYGPDRLLRMQAITGAMAALRPPRRWKPQAW